MGFFCDLIIFVLGCIFLLCAAIKKTNIFYPTIISGCGFILVSILSFFVFPFLRIFEILFIIIFFVFNVCNLLIHIIGKKAVCPYTICVPGAQVKNGKISPTFNRRLDLAISLYHKYNEKPFITVCGGTGLDEKVSEAQSGSEYLISKGVESQKIIKEETSSNTYESFNNLFLLLPNKKSTVLIATSSYGLIRAVFLAKKASLNAKAIGCHDPLHMYMSYSLREMLAIVYYYFKLS